METKNKILLSLFLFLFLAVIVWTNLHELMHITTLKIFNYSYEYNWNLFIPRVHCIDCDTSQKIKMFVYNFLPYILDLIAMATGAVLYRYKAISYLMHFGYFDIISNYFSMILALPYKIPNDFLNVIRLGFWYVPIFLFLISTFLWYKFNKKLLVKKIKELKLIFG